MVYLRLDFVTLVLILALAFTSTHGGEVILPHYTGEVIPKPQQNLTEPQFLLLDHTQWSIEIADDASGAIQLAAQLLEQRLVEQAALLESTDNKQDALPIVIHLGLLSDSKKSDLNIDDLELPNQGYIIRVRPSEDSLNVYALGVDARGAFYAAATLIQQIGVEDNRLGLRGNDLNDWPAWNDRYFGDYTPYGENAMLWCALNKISGYAIQTRNEWRYFAPEVKPRWSKYPNWQAALDEMGEFRRATGLVDYMIILHLYAARPREHPIINIAKEQDIQDFIARCRYAAENGFSHIMIAADDMTRHDGTQYVCAHEDEACKFDHSIGRAHGYLVKRVYNTLIREYPDLQFSFVPAPYSLDDHRVPQLRGNQKYLHDMAVQLPEEVYVVWTGPKVLSSHISLNDSDAFREYVRNLRLILWDNTNETGHPPMPVWRTQFDDDYTADAQFIYANTHLFGWPWDQAYAAAANGYLWNPNNFDPTGAHSDATVKLHGPGADKLAETFIHHKEELDLKDEAPEIKKKHVEVLESVVGEMKQRGMPTKYLQGFIDSRKGRLTTEIPELSIPLLSSPPKIDGRLDDKCWSRAAAFEMGPANRARKEKYPANGMIGYDSDNLYLAFIVRHSTTLKAPKIPDRRDEPIYNQSDAIELFFLADPNKGYGHMVFDFVGHLYDKHHGDESSLGLGWNPAWYVEFQYLEEGQWIAEVKIPFASLEPFVGSVPVSGDTWRGNFCRFSIHDSQTSNWSATFGKFHQTQRFGILRFE